MKLGKKEMIISIVMMIVFLVLGLNFGVFATNTEENKARINFNLSGNNSVNNSIPVNNSTGTNNNIEKDQEIENNNSSTGIPTNNNVNTNTAKEDVPDTGLEDAPWLVIAVCGISAIFAFKKIKEYNEV